MKYHSLTIEETLKKLNTDPVTGLSEKEVRIRRQANGPNTLAVKKKKSLFLRFLAQFSDFMILVLIAAAVISFLVSLAEGEADFVDPLIILTIIMVNAILGLVQEEKAEKALEALKQMSAPNALVLREGKRTTIPSQDLVPGDIIFLETGHYVPADARLLGAVNLKVDESALTGESHPVGKDAELVLKEETMLGDRKNMVPSTGIVTYGRGTAVVTATGMQTEVGHIAALIMEDVTPDTPLQKRLAKTGQMLGIAALCICIIIFVIGAIQGRQLFTMFMTSVSLAVAAIPEGLPAVVTIMLSLGVQRMAKKNAVIRKLPAVETLGSATYICSDKTGTLTQNKMTVTAMALPDGTEVLPKPKETLTKEAEALFTAVLLCNNAVPEAEQESKRKKSKTQEGLPAVSGEPTEQALFTAALCAGINYGKVFATYPRVRELPFDSVRKRMTTVHKLPDGGYLSVTKGAFDLLLPLCSNCYLKGKKEPLTSAARNRLKRQNDRLTSQALRVLAVSVKRLNQPPSTLTDAQLEQNLTFLGLLGMIDPPRPEVRDAVLLCQSAGITPVMITGDHAATACAIAKDLGILKTVKVPLLPSKRGMVTAAGGGSEEELSVSSYLDTHAVTGEQLNRMTDAQLEEKIYQYRVFARVSPEHKVRIVKALQRQGEVVAMTGDGVNDAPALKAADIGCVMGKTGTDVAKNASDMILMDDNFATIVAAVREGRGIYDNIKKSIHFLLSSNIGEIITIFAAILFGLPSPLAAVQLLWVNLVTDSLPAIALGVEPPAADIMNRPPISPKKGMFADGLVFKIIFEGAMIGLLALIAYMLGGGTCCFAVLGLSQLFHAFNMRSEHSLKTIGLGSNPKMLLSFIACAFLQIGVISFAPLAEIFQVTPLSPVQWLLTAVLSFLPIPIVEMQKNFAKKWKERR